MNIIVCVNSDWAIGYNGNLLYNIPQDMQFFKSKTFNKTVVMGRKTYQSLRIKPLPNRYNVVLSNSLSLVDNSKNLVVCNSLESLCDSIKSIPKEDIFIIGGERVYKTFINDCSIAYVTKVYDTHVADTFFPLNLDTSNDWNLIEKSKVFEYENLKYSFNVYKKL